MSISKAKYSMGMTAVTASQFCGPLQGNARVAALEDGQLLLQLEDGHDLANLRVFGTLVSPNLRNAQEDFKLALMAVVKLINARNKLCEAVNRVHHVDM
jgi:hypothetical protein